ncbi:hypothetical protein OIE62_23765 [Streptomyces scopuliridis]|uniref:Uncharacterized protein n=1 Tax=Streptomyces scopuliridis TaxID=452529 RepID=A0ACD4ZKP3_9ACTN|nr:hypothetical protein [Streptomyces scopuliridis]WSB98591.1 hypothetical protein OG835_17180 [Streptomyces scopuliridis]WSC07706.1 hypothetical protein OIE62_23765 [Streptomyces scopuliridis]
MDAIQQHMLDSYRAARRGERAPPPPGRYDRETLRTIREYRRFRAITEPESRPPWRARVRTALMWRARRSATRPARRPGGPEPSGGRTTAPGAS